jgi:hypothetical protein
MSCAEWSVAYLAFGQLSVSSSEVSARQGHKTRRSRFRDPLIPCRKEVALRHEGEVDQQRQRVEAVCGHF